MNGAEDPSNMKTPGGEGKGGEAQAAAAKDTIAQSTVAQSTEDHRAVAQNADAPMVRTRLDALGWAAFCLCAVTTVAYFSYRIPLTNLGSPVFSLALLAAEMFGVVTLLLHYFSSATLLIRGSRRVPPGVTADIFVTTWNEPVEMLRNTLLAAKRVRHARRVWLLDDGARPEMRALAAKLGVDYLSRTDRSHAKAGNLNNALAHTEAQFIAQFDCDHCPAPDFLEKTLGYFSDPKISFVQTPQDFYNIDSFQHRKNAQATEYWHEQTLFYRVIQPGKDNLGAAFFCGSCAVIRASALADIGGFATGTITEDIHTSIKLHKHGWGSAFHMESLAYGVAPSNLDQYETQRLRWGRGAMQVWRKEGLLFRPGLTMAQRLCYFGSVITYFEGWQKAILYFSPVIVLSTGLMPIHWTGDRFLQLFLLWLLSCMLVNEAVGRGYTRTMWMEEYNCLRYFTFMNATLALIIPIKWRFRVTPKNLDASAGSIARFAPQLTIICATVIAFIIGAYRYFNDPSYLPFGAYVSNAIWATLTAVIAARAISFSMRKATQRRHGHRFAIPVVVQLDGVANANFLIADDLSAGGMRVLANAGTKLPAKISGKLRLPSGVIDFNARLRRQGGLKESERVGNHYQFDWPDGEPENLSVCLFGNSLQWAANDWKETAPRDAGWRDVVDNINPFARMPVRAPAEEWNIGVIRSPDGEEALAIVQRSRRDPDTWRALSYEAPPAVNDVAIQIFALGHNESRLTLTGSQGFQVGDGMVFVFVLKRETALASGALASADLTLMKGARA